MKRLFILLALACSAVSAQAQTAVSGAAALSGSLSGAGAAATGNEINIGASVIPSQTRNDQNLHYDGTYTIKNVPNVVVPNIFPTAPCMGSSALGGSVAGFGIGGGSSWIAENCEHRENARLLHAMGDVPNAKVAMCMQSTMTNHPMCKGITPVKAEAPDNRAQVSPKDPRVTTGSDRGRDNANGVFSKSEEDRQLTLAAMSSDPQRAQCDYAKRAGDQVLAARFGCAK